MPLGLPTSNGCGKDLTLLSVFGEYRNVLGDGLSNVGFRGVDPENELGRCEPLLGAKLRGLDPILGEKLRGLEPMLGEKLRGLEARGLGLSATPLRIGFDLWPSDGLGARNEGREGVGEADLDGLLNEGLRQLGLEPIDGPGRLDPMDGPEFLENDRCMLDDRSDLSRATAGLPNERIVWGPNRLLVVGEISTAAVITTTAARHLFFFSVTILLLLPLGLGETPAKLRCTDQQPTPT